MFVLPHWIIVASFWSAVAAAVLAGGRDERVYAAIQTVFGVLAFYGLGLHRYGDRVGVELILQITLTAMVIPFGMFSKKLWPIAAASLACATLMTEVAQLVQPVAKWAYGTAQLTWSQMQNALLVVASWQAWRQRRAARLLTATPD